MGTLLLVRNLALSIKSISQTLVFGFALFVILRVLKVQVTLGFLANCLIYALFTAIAVLLKLWSDSYPKFNFLKSYFFSLINLPHVQLKQILLYVLYVFVSSMQLSLG